MYLIYLLVFLLLSAGVYFVPSRAKYYFTLILELILLSVSSFLAVKVLATHTTQVIHLPIKMWSFHPTLYIDKISAIFILIINFTALTAFLYAKGYLAPYREKKTNLAFSMHYFSYLWLHASMLGVTMAYNGLLFLLIWEIMSLTSFILVIFDAEDNKILKAGIHYLIQMHVGLLFIMAGFLISGLYTGNFGFLGTSLFFSSHSNFILFLIFFIGFGIKAGFIPLHTWLPEAHPAAPSHVSGLMSGVMIKVGIYGIVRVLLLVQSDFLWIGGFLLVISLISGILGVMFAIVQHDLKRLLAYHSIENIGIIGIGLGLGTIGIGIENPVLAILGFSGGILHVLNHSLFKSLLFYSAGSVYKACHTRNVEQLGGLINKMPKTAVFFLIGSLAICGLPPFNGFISEYLIYLGLFKGITSVSLYHAIIFLCSIIGLVLIGGLAIFCFTKAFGIVFLGVPRSDKTAHATEADSSMIFPKILITILIVGIGLLPLFIVAPLSGIVAGAFGLDFTAFRSIDLFSNLSGISLVGGIFVILSSALIIYRYIHLKNKKIEYGPTWGCGYTAGNYKQQYTATSYADNYAQLANPILQVEKHIEEIKPEDIFPQQRHFESHGDDVIKTKFINQPVGFFTKILKKLAMLQTGQIQHYILYAFLFMLLVFVLTFFNII